MTHLPAGTGEAQLARGTFGACLPVRLKLVGPAPGSGSGSGSGVGVGAGAGAGGAQDTGTGTGTVEFQSPAKAELAYATVYGGPALHILPPSSSFSSSSPYSASAAAFTPYGNQHTQEYASSQRSADPLADARPRLIKHLPLLPSTTTTTTTPSSTFPHHDPAANAQQQQRLLLLTRIYLVLRPFGALRALRLVEHAPRSGAYTGFRGHALAWYYDERHARAAQARLDGSAWAEGEEEEGSGEVEGGLAERGRTISMQVDTLVRKEPVDPAYSYAYSVHTVSTTNPYTATPTPTGIGTGEAGAHSASASPRSGYASRGGGAAAAAGSSRGSPHMVWTASSASHSHSSSPSTPYAYARNQAQVGSPQLGQYTRSASARSSLDPSAASFAPLYASAAAGPGAGVASEVAGDMSFSSTTSSVTSSRAPSGSSERTRLLLAVRAHLHELRVVEMKQRRSSSSVVGDNSLAASKHSPQLAQVAQDELLARDPAEEAQLEQQVERVTALLLGLPKRERAMCLFNADYLAGKIEAAREILALEEEEEGGKDGEHEHEQGPGGARVGLGIEPPARAGEGAEAGEEAEATPRLTKANLEAVSAASASGVLSQSPTPPTPPPKSPAMALQQQQQRGPLTSNSGAANGASKGITGAGTGTEVPQTLAQLARLPSHEIVKLLSASSTTTSGSRQLPEAVRKALPPEDADAQKIAEETDAFVDSLAGQATSDQKQRLGDRLYRKIKGFGIKGAPKISESRLRHLYAPHPR